MTALLALELRRQRPMFVRMALVTVVIGLVFFVAGKRTPADLLATLVGSGLGVALIVPMGIARDKMEGTLEFICGLPIEPHDIAASRFVAIALVAVPWAVGVGALSLAVPAIGVLNPVGVTALTWLAMFLLGSCAAALLTRFDLESMLGAPLVAMVILLVLVPRVVHALIPGMTAETVVQFLARPSAAFVLGCGLVVVVGAIGLAAFVVAERGFANYRANTARH